MGHEKVTVMILDVDLKCSYCYKKVKRVLCKFPQIRDQMFDEDKNKVLIKVVCCNPEKIRDKLCCKGGKVIQRIEIVEDKPKGTTKPKGPVNPEPVKQPKVPDNPSGKGDKPKSDPPVVGTPPIKKPKVDPPKADPPKKPVKMPDPMQGCPWPVYPPPVSACCEECSEGRRGGPCEYGYGRPISTCCAECYEGRRGGPCEYGYGRPVLPPPGPCYDGYGNQYGGNRPCYVSRCDYFSEENPRGCSIM